MRVAALALLSTSLGAGLARVSARGAVASPMDRSRQRLVVRAGMTSLLLKGLQS